MENENQRLDAHNAGERLLASHPSEDPFAAAFKATRMPMLITDPRQHDNPIIFSNRAFTELTGYSQHELVGRNCRLLQGPDTDRKAIAKIRHAVSAAHDVSVDVLNYRQDGSTFWNSLYVSPVRNREGEVIYFFASQLDVTDVKSKETELAKARRAAEEEASMRNAELIEALRVQTELVHEVDHRVKNNLLTIASIIKLQMRTTRNTIVANTLRSILNRVEALSTVQRKVLNHDQVGQFDVADFGRDLVTDIVGSLKTPDIDLSTDLHSVIVSGSKASALALVVNELVGDAVRRGLSDGGGKIHLEIRRLNGDFLIRVVDFVTPVEVDGEQKAFSRAMLDASIRQLKATMKREVDGHRTEVCVMLPVGD